MNEDMLVKTGLLFEINRKILHPVEKTLIYDPESSRLELVDHSIDPDYAIFEEAEMFAGDKKLRKYMLTEGNQCLKRRKDKWGYIVQQIYKNF